MRKNILWSVILVFTLFACSKEDEQVATAQPSAAGQSDAVAESSPDTPDELDEEFVEQYKAKVRKRVSGSVVSSLAREWGVSEAKVECLYKDLKTSQLMQPPGDPEVIAVFEACGVDPSVLE